MIGEIAWAASLSVKVRVVLAAEMSPKTTVEAVLILEPTRSGTAEDPAAIAMPIAVPGEAAISLPNSDPWKARLESDTWWAESVLIKPAGGDVEVSLKLFPLARLHASLAVAGDSPPSGIEVRFSQAISDAPPPEPQVPGGTVTCQLSQLEVHCSAPAGQLDLRFKAEGFAPIYLWNLNLGAAKSKELGVLPLLSGGSVVGWVKDAAGEPLTGVEVALTPPMQAEVLDPTLEGRLRRQELGATTNERGFFQVGGIPPGTYRVAGTKEGYARSQLDQLVVVGEQAEEALDDVLVMARPAILRLSLEPLSDVLGEPWNVKLYVTTRNRYLGTPIEGHTTEAGQWVAGGLDPTEYLLRVLDSEGKPWIVREIELEAGERFLHVEIPIVEIEGTVVLGRDPVPGTLWLADKGARLEFHIGEEGEFSGLLPSEGEWRPVVAPAELSGTMLALKPVQVKLSRGKSVAKVDIEIPDTRLQGKVVGHTGEAVPEARIRVAGEGKTISTTTSDDQGQFEIWGVLPGNTLVQASKDGLDSDSTAVSLQEEMIPPALLLVLREETEVSGQVLSESGPVAGARILAWPDLNSSPSFEIADEGSNLDGVFYVDVQTNVPWLNLVVQAPGFGTRILRQPVNPDEPILVLLEKNGGNLVLDVRESGWPPRAARPEGSREPRASIPLLYHEGVTILFPMLRVLSQKFRPPALQGQLLLPAMESGSYSLCTVDFDSVQLIHWEAPAASLCTSGFLPPGGELVLTAGGGAAAESGN